MSEISSDDHFIVVGSGPSAVACATALVAGGRRVLMLDVGRTLDPTKRALLRNMVEAPSYSQPPADLYAEDAWGCEADVEVKRAYGSAFAYAADDMHNIVQKGTWCVTSLANGGLSNVWGAAVLPFRDAEIAHWPVTGDDLRPHYDAVSRLIGLRGSRDDLAELFPLPAGVGESPSASPESRLLLAHLSENREALRRSGFTFGRSRLAMRFRDGDIDCAQCGRCLAGCPYDLIYRAGHTVADLLAHPFFSYRPGLRVERIARDGEGIRVHAREESGGGQMRFRGSRAFLGCGPLASARIVAASLAKNINCRLHYHPYFLLPAFTRFGCGDVRGRPTHTLAQIFAELLEPAVSPHCIHMQAYTYSEQIGQEVFKRLPRIPGLRGVAERRLMGRLVAIQGYLHSAHGAPIELSVDGTSGQAPVHLRGELGDAGKTALRRVMNILWRNRRALGLTPLTALAKVGQPGEGNHIGANFPMRSVPAAWETNILGEMPGLDRVHLIDASVLPDLPATTLTLTVMANAHRIGALMAKANRS